MFFKYTANKLLHIYFFNMVTDMNFNILPIGHVKH